MDQGAPKFDTLAFSFRVGLASNSGAPSKWVVPCTADTPKSMTCGNSAFTEDLAYECRNTLNTPQHHHLIGSLRAWVKFTPCLPVTPSDASKCKFIGEMLLGRGSKSDGEHKARKEVVSSGPEPFGVAQEP